MTQNPNLAALSAAGVSVWLDDLSRERLQTGNLQDLIDTRSVVGVTTNPSIFQAALSKGTAYDAQVAELAARGADVDATIRTVTTDDVRDACDVLAKQYEPSDGVDGRVSIEVDPRLAHDTDKTIAQAIELWKIVDRPNVLIKIPATLAGLPAITAVIAEGISVNVTLIFSVERYQRGDGRLPRRAGGGQGRRPRPVQDPFRRFVLRLPGGHRDRQAAGDDRHRTRRWQLRGKAGVANARLAYAAYEQIFERRRPVRGARRRRRPGAAAAVGVHRREEPRLLRHPLRHRTGRARTPSTPCRRRRSTPSPTTARSPATPSPAPPPRPRRSSTSWPPSASTCTDVFKVLENEGVDKFEKSWSELLDATAEQLDAASQNELTCQRSDPRRTAGSTRCGTSATSGCRASPGPCARGDLRGHRRPGPQEADAGDLRPGQPRAAAARRSRWSGSPAGTGPTRTSARSCYDAVKEHARTPFRQEVWDRLAEGIRFVQGTFDDDEAFDRLADTLADARRRARHRRQSRVLPVDPARRVPAWCCEQLSQSGLADAAGRQWRRVVIEKPFGHDLESAESTQRAWSTASSRRTRCSASTTTSARRRCRTCWRCGSPTSCSSRSGTRTTSTTCRSPWPRTSASAAAPATTTASAPPATSSRTTCCSCWRSPRWRSRSASRPAELQAEKIKVLSATQLAEPLDETTSRGQYTAGWQGGEKVVGLLDEEGFSKTSTTETFAAITPRGGHPPLGRGAVLPADRKAVGPQGHRDRAGVQARTASAVRRHHDRGTRQERAGDPGAAGRGHHAAVRFQGARPSMEVRDVNMDFSYGPAFAEESPEAYERLILDVLLGEPSLFPVNAEVELSWKILDPALEQLGRRTASPTRTSRAAGDRSRRSRCCAPRTGGARRVEDEPVIVDLPDTTTNEVNKKLVELREEGGAVTMGRVLTLVIAPDTEALLEDSIEAANYASREHPCRVIVVSPGDRLAERTAAGRPDPGRRRRRCRRGGGAAVVRSAGRARQQRGDAVPAARHSGRGVVARHRARGSRAGSAGPVGDPPDHRRHQRRRPAGLRSRAGWTATRAGDTDLCWSRITYWRALLTSALDQAPHEPITSAVVSGLKSEPALDILAGWLASRIDGPVTRAVGELKVELTRDSETITLSRPQDGVTATLQPHRPARRPAPAGPPGDPGLPGRGPAPSRCRRDLPRGLAGPGQGASTHDPSRT